jgi:3-oxoacyl-(acyl-carrier-protein) synthase
MGCVASNAFNIAAFKSALYHGISGIEKHPELKEYNFRCQVAGIAKLPPKTHLELEARRLSTKSDFVQLSCTAAIEAWENAGLQVPDSDSEEVDWDTGIIIGTSAPGTDIVGSKIVPLTNANTVKRIGGFGALNIMGSAPSNLLSSILSAGNACYGNSVACATGTNAIIEGFQRIQLGHAKRMVVGGVEGYSSYMWASLDAMRVMTSANNDNPKAASRPMSANAAGFVPASGAGILVLEELNTALERNAPIVAEIVGGYMNTGGQRNGGTLTFPSSEGLIRCIEGALKQANIKPEQIDSINGHLTGTKADVVEIRNWAKVFKGVDFPTINATKSLIGHTIGAAGAIESIASLLQMQHNFIHPSLNCEDLHPDILDLIPENKIVRTTRTDVDLNTIIKSSFGFGDVNSTVIYKRLKDK